MNLEQRKNLLVRLGQLMLSEDAAWEQARKKAFAENPWFIPEFIDRAARQIAANFLNAAALEHLICDYQIPARNASPRKVGIIMAGNIPLVGFHDLLCVFLTGHQAYIKLSSKDEVLIPFLIKMLQQWEPQVVPCFVIADLLKGCDAYIATGSNNSARYFDYYFRKYPHIIRRNRTSVAVLTGSETKEDLEQLADDVYLYFGLGCRNVTKMYVPQGYQFQPLLEVFKKYDHLINYSRYKNNYDYNLAMLILNKRYYMSNGSILLVEDPTPFSRIGILHYEFYKDRQSVYERLQASEDIQCVVGQSATGFGCAQTPGLCDFADGVDTIRFLLELES